MNPPNRKVDPAIARSLALDEGLSCGQIAARIGCSDQAVSDALRRQGLDPAQLWLERKSRERAARLQAHRAALAEKRRAASEKHFAAWFPLWEQGYTYKEMASILGTTTTTVAWTTCRLRESHGWFPRRQAVHKDLTVVAADWRQLWAEGLTAAEIAKRVGCTPHYVGNVIFKLRKRHGWFPARVSREPIAA